MSVVWFGQEISNKAIFCIYKYITCLLISSVSSLSEVSLWGRQTQTNYFMQLHQNSLCTIYSRWKQLLRHDWSQERPHNETHRNFYSPSWQREDERDIFRNIQPERMAPLSKIHRRCYATAAAERAHRRHASPSTFVEDEMKKIINKIKINHGLSGVSCVPVCLLHM